MRILNQRSHHYLNRMVAFSVAAMLALTPALSDAGQRRGGGGRSGGERSGGGTRVGTAAPRGGDSSKGSGGSGGGSTRTASGGGQTQGRSGGDGGNSGAGRATARARDGQPTVGEAVARRGYGGGATVIVPGSYYGGFLPWGFGGFGLAGYYGGGFYDPWFYGGQPYYYGGGGYADGALRLKVKPHDATVLVDGYFAGQVNDFDGVFQRLRLEPGPHRIEISAEGYEPLTFEIRVLPDRTTTYKGELTRIQ